MTKICKCLRYKENFKKLNKKVNCLFLKFKIFINIFFCTIQRLQVGLLYIKVNYAIMTPGCISRWAIWFLLNTQATFPRALRTVSCWSSILAKYSGKISSWRMQILCRTQLDIIILHVCSIPDTLMCCNRLKCPSKSPEALSIATLAFDKAML